jgi:urease accessory protein
MYLDETGGACTFLLNPSGGLVGGDRLFLRASIGSDAQVLISSPSANRVYRSPSSLSTLAVQMSVGRGAMLEWLPDLTIPYAGSRFRQKIHVTLAPRATALIWDAMAAGRVARNERWAFTRYENEIRVVTASGASLLERFSFNGRDNRLAPARWMEEWNYLGSLYLVGDSLDENTRSSLANRAGDVIARAHGAILGGVSEPAAPGLVVKLLARSATELNEALTGVWQTIRGGLWNLPLPDLRRY